MDYVTEQGTYEQRVQQANKERKSTRTRKARPEVPIWEKQLLTLEEAAEYSGLGTGKLRSLSNDEDCPFVLWNGHKRLIKREKLDEYLDGAYSI